MTYAQALDIVLAAAEEYKSCYEYDDDCPPPFTLEELYEATAIVDPEVAEDVAYETAVAQQRKPSLVLIWCNPDYHGSNK